MLKLRLGNQIINLFKSAKGSEKAGHKYCRREGGTNNWTYWYPAPDGKCGDGREIPKKMNEKQARRAHPERHDPARNKSMFTTEYSKNIVNYLGGGLSSDKSIFNYDSGESESIRITAESLTKDYEAGGTARQKAQGFLNEDIYVIAPYLDDLNLDWDDYAVILKKKYDMLKDKNDVFSINESQRVRSVLINFHVLQEFKAKKDGWDGTQALTRAIEGARNTYLGAKASLQTLNGGEINRDNIRFNLVGKKTGKGKKADLAVEIKNDSGDWEIASYEEKDPETGETRSFQLVYGLKAGKGAKVTQGDTTPKAMAQAYIDSGNEYLVDVGKKLQNEEERLNKQFKGIKDVKVRSREIMYAIADYELKLFGFDNVDKSKDIDNRTETQKDMTAARAQFAVDRYFSDFTDRNYSNMVLNVTKEFPDGSGLIFQCTSSTFEKKMRKEYFDKYPVGVSWGYAKGEGYKSITGKTFKSVAECQYLSGPPEDRKVFKADSWRHNRIMVQSRAEGDIALNYMAKTAVQEGRKVASGPAMLKVIPNPAANDNPSRKTAQEMMKLFSFEGIGKALRIITLFKSTQTTERQKMNAKYIRKELTESGKVRYIYKETNPRKKRVDEPEPVRRNQFNSTTDSVDPAYKALFEESIGEIADEHFININAGCASVRFTKDVDVFLDALDVPKELRDNEEFTGSSGSFNVSKGKMAFCTSNFPDDASEIIKKAVMMHEVGHAYFYGTLRIKAKKPLAPDAVDTKDKDQKDFVKNSTKFVDTFGKMDEELRKKAEFDIEGAKGADKETLLQDAIMTYMVSEYATLSPEEHFAEAFSRYFIMPEQLRKKEPEVYEHFEQFFQKYGE